MRKSEKIAWITLAITLLLFALTVTVIILLWRADSASARATLAEERNKRAGVESSLELERGKSARLVEQLADFRRQLGDAGELAGRLADGLRDASARAGRMADYRGQAQVLIDAIREAGNGLGEINQKLAIPDPEI